MEKRSGGEMGEDSILNASLRICRKGQILIVPHHQENPKLLTEVHCG